jgi:hypothetical protein
MEVALISSVRSAHGSRLLRSLLERVFCASALAMLFASPVAAQLEVPPLAAGSIQMSGSGCPGDSEARLLDRPTRFEVHFDALRAAGAESVSSCNIALSFMVPAGVSVRLIGAELAGMAAIGPQVQSSIRRDYFLAGEPRGARIFEFEEMFDGSFLFQDDVREQLADPEGGWTRCSAVPSMQVAMVSVQLVAAGAQNAIAIHFGRLFDLETQACTPE